MFGARRGEHCGAARLKSSQTNAGGMDHVRTDTSGQNPRKVLIKIRASKEDGFCVSYVWKKICAKITLTRFLFYVSIRGVDDVPPRGHVEQDDV